MNANNNNIAINVSHSPFIQKIKPWFWIIVGCTIMSGGFVFFINPYNIVPGGVYGASIVLHNIFPSIQVGTFGYFFDIPLMIISVLLLGSKLGIRTIVAAMISPLIMNGLSWLAYPTQEALMRLDPALLCGGVINMTDHLMLTTLIGGALIGVVCYRRAAASHHRRQRHRGDDSPEICACAFFKRHLFSRCVRHPVWFDCNRIRNRQCRRHHFSIMAPVVLLADCHLHQFQSTRLHHQRRKKRQIDIHHQQPAATRTARLHLERFGPHRHLHQRTRLVFPQR